MGDAMIHLTEQRVSRGLVLLVCLTWLSVIAPSDAHGQQPSATDQAAAEFDLSRARLAERTRFVPFGVTESSPLREVLEEGVIHEGTPLLVVDYKAGRLALLTEQMMYHHVAQGEMKGEPWLVSF